MATKQTAVKQTAKSGPGTAVARPSSAPVVMGDDAPDYIRVNGARGSEGVGASDLVIPRLDIVQSLSPYRKKGDPKQIAGVEEGDLVNSVTMVNYGSEVLLVPVIYRKEYLVWRDRKLAETLNINAGQGGFFGAYATPELADKRAKEEGGKEKAIVVVDTPQNFCLLVNAKTGMAEEIVISMARSKARPARRWNSLIRLTGGDRFSRVYKMTTVFEKGQKGDYYNFDVTQLGFPSKEIYHQAEKLYTDINSGMIKARADMSDADAEAPADDDM